jgi:hypothetical protein
MNTLEYFRRSMIITFLRIEPLTLTLAAYRATQ